MRTKITILAMLIASFCSAQQVLSWQQMQSLPEIVYSPASFSIGNKIYVVSGMLHWMSFDPILSNHVWEYDTETDNWTMKASFPFTWRYGARAFTIGNYGYIVGGYNGSSFLGDCQRYDPATDTWQTMAIFPGTARYTSATFTIGNKGYISCGFSPYTNDMWEYDPALDSWTQKSDLPGSTRQALPYFTIGENAYLGMGGQEFTLYPRDWYRYTPATDTWIQLNDFPDNALTAAYPFVINNDGYLAMGQSIDSITGDISVSNKLWKYTESEDSWTELAAFPDTALFEGAYASCNGAGWIGLGAKGLTVDYSSQWWRFGPESTTESINESDTENLTLLSFSDNHYQMIIPSDFMGGYSFQLVDMTGKVVLSELSCTQNAYEVNLSNFASGAYAYSIQNRLGKTVTGKLTRK